MTARPILFQPDMVRAILEGKKTQTRRVLKDAPTERGWHLDRVGPTGFQFTGQGGMPRMPLDPGYKIGDLLYVREAWRTWSLIDLAPPKFMQSSEIVLYEADGTVNKHNPRFVPGRFRQAMHMPRWASRLTLEVTDVRVDRIQYISGQDAVAEGVRSRLPDNGVAQAEFKDLWDRINGPRGLGWYANPWVVALTFKVYHCNIDQMEWTKA